VEYIVTLMAGSLILQTIREVGI